MKPTPEEHWPRLSPGTQVGDWRVESLQDQGAYGAVYRAVRTGQESAAPVAIKFALYPWDARVVREAELLSRLGHPSIPRLLGRGVLRHVSGVEHPWFAMEWVEGTPLYDWALQHAPSHWQLCQLLAQLARALEAMHGAGAVHRDVKGANVLVRHSDGRAVLIDFGSGHFQGAERLTWQSLAPSTPAYLSAQANLFYIRLARERDSYYPPSPADDLFALGVTAYRLVMGEYPPPMDVREDEEGNWQVTSPDPRPLLENNPRVLPQLRELILRLLSDSPEVRGTAAQLAAALVTAATENMPSERPRPPSPVQAWRPWLALAATGIYAVLLWNMEPVPVPSEPLFESTHQASNSHAPDAGTAAVGEASPAETPDSDPPPAEEEEPITQEPPPDPHPRQAKPDEKGQCPGRKQVVINGGCWVEIPSMPPEECEENGYVVLKGKCYASALETRPRKRRTPTSSPTKAR
jgi:serine/threonine protein kinase